MSMPAQDDPIGTVTQIWVGLRESLDAFSREWESGQIPRIDAYLPVNPPELRRLTLIELIKIDLAHRLKQDSRHRVEFYLDQFLELAPTEGPPADLIFEEFQLRKQSGESVQTDELFDRFPKRAGELARLLGISSPAQSTSVMAVRSPKSVKAGDRLDDFDLLAFLGEGQFAKVFLARQVTMQRLVALKVSSCVGSEAETLAQLDHPNIVRVYDQRYLRERSLLLVYMPYLAGGTLLDVVERVRQTPKARRSGKLLIESVDASLHRRGELPPASSMARHEWMTRSWPETVCALGVKLARALDYAHQHDVLHRDIKPANVLLTSEGEPLLADFNIGCCSKLEGAGPTSFFGGSLGYMSAEHLEAFNPAHERSAESLNGQADVFSLAVTLWELLTGSRPFGKEKLEGNWTKTLEKLVEQRKSGPLPSMLAEAEDSDVIGLRETLLACLDADPAKRPKSAGALARELELCLKPQTRELLRPTPGGWREFVRKHPLLTILPVGLAPNGIASIFNISYNQAEIIDHWPNAVNVFQTIIMIVNGIFFPLGTLVFVLSVWGTIRGLRSKPGELPATEMARIRRLSLRLGGIGAWVCVGCWGIAGLIWPIALRIVAGSPPQGAWAYIHFLLSLVICGLVAAAYPYFLVTFLAVRVIYPALLGKDGPTAEDTRILKKIERELGRYRMAAAAVPLLTVAILASRGVSHPFAVAAMSATGLAGTLVAFMLEGRTRADLVALTATSEIR